MPILATLDTVQDPAAAAEACRTLIRAYEANNQDVDWSDVTSALSQALAAFGLPESYPEDMAEARATENG